MAKTPNVDVILDLGNFRLHAWFNDGAHPGYITSVSLGSAVIFENSTIHPEQYVDLADFANISLKKFTDRLKVLFTSIGTGGNE